MAVNDEIPRSRTAPLKFESGADFAEWLPGAWEKITSGVIFRWTASRFPARSPESILR